MCYSNKDELQGVSGKFHRSPDLPMWTRRERIQLPQYSWSARGSQLPEGGMLLPYCFALLVGLLPGHMEDKEHAYATARLS
jgi:hypothetical protein